MALATQCPHCHTTFRVAADQLKLRGGIVRCGACQRIFDGNAHLIDLDKPAAPPPQDTHDAGADALPVYTLDFDHTFDPLGILPKTVTPDEAQPAPEPGPAVPAPRAQVWRTGGVRAPEPDDDAPAVHTAAPADEMPAAPPALPAAEAAPIDVDASAAAPVAAQADTPSPAPSYAPAGRVEPRLDAVVAAEAESASVAEPPADATTAPSQEPTPEPPEASAYAPTGRIEPSFGLPVDEEIVAQPLPDFEPEPEPEPQPAPEPEPVPAPAAVSPPAPVAEPLAEPGMRPAVASAATPTDDIPPAALPLRASAASEPSAPSPAMIPPVTPARSKAARTSEARARRSKLTPTKIEPPKLRLPADGDADEPEFVKRSRRQERMGRTRRLLMALGAVALLLALLAQAVLGFRNVLAAQHPAMKPALQAACVVLGCRVELPAQVENLVIETGELTTLGPNTYALNTLLRNQGNLVLAWPSIELELTDANDKPVLRRVLAPADYLPRGTPAANGFDPHSEQPVTLNFTLAGLQPSGYHTFVFYP
jgi:predicted Zn finger-like uncharacterized protein